MITADQVKEMRVALGESQVVFGARFGIDQSTAHRWETDGPPRRGPAQMALQKLQSELFPAREDAHS